MLRCQVKPDGSLLIKNFDQHAIASQIATASAQPHKPRWKDYTDNGPPTYDPRTHQCAKSTQETADALTVVYTVTPRDLETVKREFCALVDKSAGDLRRPFLTDEPGQEMTYQEKYAQALKLFDMGQTAVNALSLADAIADYPTIAASIQVEAPTLWECVLLVIARYEGFVSLSYHIELRRLSGKASVTAASDVDGARQAYEAIEWTLPT